MSPPGHGGVRFKRMAARTAGHDDGIVRQESVEARSGIGHHVYSEVRSVVQHRMTGGSALTARAGFDHAYPQG